MDWAKWQDIVADGAGEAADVLRAYHEASDACVLGDMEACNFDMGNLQHKLFRSVRWLGFRNQSQFYFK